MFEVRISPTETIQVPEVGDWYNLNQKIVKVVSVAQDHTGIRVNEVYIYRKEVANDVHSGGN